MMLNMHESNNEKHYKLVNIFVNYAFVCRRSIGRNQFHYLQHSGILYTRYKQCLLSILYLYLYKNILPDNKYIV